MNNSKYIVIEGIDGSGKSTLARSLANKIESSKLVAEPSGILGPQIREIIRDNPLSSESMAVLFTADRILHINNTIKPALKAGRTVISDRGKLSTFVYQSQFNCPRSFLKSLCSIPKPNPDLTIVVDIDPTIAQRRMLATRDLDVYEHDVEAQFAMRECYLNNADRFGRAVVLDGRLAPEVLLDKAINAITYSLSGII